MKNRAPSQILYSLFLPALAALLSCSPLRTAGGSEIGNPTNARVVGTVVYPGEGGFVAGADVRLRPKTFCKDTTLAALFKTSETNANTLTDQNGRFVLDSVDTGEYSIEVNDGKSHAALIPCSVDGLAPVLTLPVYTALPTSPITGTIMAAKNGNAVYIQVFGLDRVARADSATGQFSVSDVPQGSYALRVLSSSTPGDSLIKNNVSVSGAGTNIGVIDLVSFGGWSNSRKLLLNTTASGAGVSGTVTDFPVLVRLTQLNFDFSRAASTGADLRFAKPDGTQLPYEIERFDPAAGLAEAWVKVDTVFGNDNAHAIIMYWGNPGAADSSNGAAVFDTGDGFAGVWHLSDGSAAQALDATGNGYNGVAYNMAAQSGMAGIIGTGREFRGDSSYITVPGTSGSKLNFPQNGVYSLSAWVYVDTIDSLYQAVISKGDEQYNLEILTDDWEFAEYENKTGWDMSQSPSPVAPRQWVLVAGVRNQANQYLYVNGQCVDSAISLLGNGFSQNSGYDLMIGRTNGITMPGFPYYFHGVLDEIRIQGRALSPAWIKLCYMNQKMPDALLQ